MQQQEELKKLQHERLQDEEKGNKDDGIQSVITKLNGEFSTFKGKYTEQKLQNMMNKTPQKLLDKQSDLNKEINIYKECVNDIVITSKSFSKYIEDIDGIIDKLSTHDLTNYKIWQIDTILKWIQGLENGRFIKYIDILQNGFIESGISGDDLPELTRSDLTLPPFNMKNFKDKKDLEKHFKSLGSPPTMRAKSEVADEGVTTSLIK